MISELCRAEIGCTMNSVFTQRSLSGPIVTLLPIFLHVLQEGLGYLSLAIYVKANYRLLFIWKSGKDRIKGAIIV